MKKSIGNQIGKEGLVPVVVIEDEDNAVDVAKALLAGGLNVMEITLRTKAGLHAIKNVAEACPEMIVGAGTVLSVNHAKQSVDMGAQFLVSPGLNPEVVEWAVKNGIEINPGCVTPTEIEQALKYGINVIKFFPASVYGGINGCKALNGPYQMVKFIPTGGINIDNLNDYADKPYIHAVGGGWLCKSTDIKAKNFGAITKTVRESVDVMLGFEFAHIGINSNNNSDAQAIAEQFGSTFDFEIKQGKSSYFGGKGIDINKTMGLGKMGYIAVKTNSIERAIYHLGKKGYRGDLDSAKTRDGKTIAVYLAEEMGGFAIQLLQK